MTNVAITPLNFTEWAHQASRGFITSGTPMSSSISKVASEHELSPVQIQRVCEIANHHAYQEMFKSAEDKAFEFPLAKVEDIMELLSEEPTKIASEYCLDPAKDNAGVDVNKIFGVQSFGNEFEVAESEKNASVVLEKIGEAKEELMSRAVLNREETSSLENEFFKMAKQLVMNDTSISDIRDACRSSAPSAKTDELIVKTAMRLAQDGVFGAKVQYMMKSAEAVEVSEISSNLAKNNPGVPTRVINGNHPIISMINTISDKWKDADNVESSLEVLDDKSRMLKKKMKDLNTSKKVDQFVKSEAF